MEPQGTLDPMTEAAIRSLHDIAVPPPVSWMPQTWGWAVLALALSVVLVLAAVRWVMRYRANAYRRESLSLLDGFEPMIRDHATRQEAIHQVGEVLKRTALAAWGRSRAASLSGRDWSAFLEEHGDEEGSRLLGRMADDFEYRSQSSLNRLPDNMFDEFVSDARRWIGGHHV